MRSIAVLCVVLALPLSLRAAEGNPGQSVDSDRFVFSGRVVDPMRAPLASARVLATPDGDRDRPTVTRTDAGGAFSIALSPGRYTLTIDADGFAPASQRIDAGRGGSASREFMLQIARVRESVDVRAEAGHHVTVSSSATKTATALRDIPQAITVVTQGLMKEQLMMSMADVMRYVPGVSVHQGENNRDQLILRGNSTSADFFVNGVRDDVQYFRDLYNLDRVEALKGPNAMIFGRGGAGGVVNRVTKDAGFAPLRGISLQGGVFGNRRVTADVDQPLGAKVAFRLNGMFEQSGSFRDFVDLGRYGVTPSLTIVPDDKTTIALRFEHLHDTRVADRGITSYQ